MLVMYKKIGFIFLILCSFSKIRIWHHKEAIFRKDPDRSEEVIDPYSAVHALSFIFSNSSLWIRNDMVRIRILYPLKQANSIVLSVRYIIGLLQDF